MTSRLKATAVVGGFVLALAGAAIWIAVDEPGQQPYCAQADAGSRANVQRHLRSVGDHYEIELWSREPFPVRALAPILRIGSRDFALSRYGPDGSLNTLIFPLSAAEYATVATGDPVAVYYGSFPDEVVTNPDVAERSEVADGWTLWSFGRLDRSRLDCPQGPVAGDG